MVHLFFQKIFPVLVLAGLAAAYPAQANWDYMLRENAFDERQTKHIAVTKREGYIFAFLCRQQAGPALRLRTPEKWKGYFSLASHVVTMKIRVDDGPIHSMRVTAYDAHGKLSFEATGNKIFAIANEIGSAKHRVSAAIFHRKKAVYNQNFKVDQAQRAILQTLSGCGASATAQPH